MEKTKKISFGVATIGLLIGLVWLLVIIMRPTTQIEKQTTFVPGPETNVAIENLKTEIDVIATYELAHGCVTENKFGDKEFCDKSKERMDSLNEKLVREIRSYKIRPAKEIAIVIKNIRKDTESPLLNVNFETRAGNPYTEKIKKDVEYYRDSKGTIYMVDPTTNQLVSFTYNDRFDTAIGKKLPLEKLRMMAEEYFTKHIKDFKQVKKDFKYSEGSKGNIYVFRYDARQKVNSEDMLPFVQVKLSTAGKLAGFSDIRSLYQ